MSARSDAQRRDLLHEQTDFDQEQRRLLRERLCAVARGDPDLTIETLAERFPALSESNIGQILSRAGIKRTGKADRWWGEARRSRR